PRTCAEPVQTLTDNLFIRTSGSDRGSLDHLVGTREQRRRHGEAERFGGLEIDDQLETWSVALPADQRFGAAQSDSEQAVLVSHAFEAASPQPRKWSTLLARRNKQSARR